MDLEDSNIPRICCCPTVEGCLKSIASDNIPYGTIYKIYAAITAELARAPSLDLVPDSLLTGEVWITSPVTFSLCGHLHVYEWVNSTTIPEYFYKGRYISVHIYNFSVQYLCNDHSYLYPIGLDMDYPEGCYFNSADTVPRDLAIDSLYNFKHRGLI